MRTDDRCSPAWSAIDGRGTFACVTFSEHQRWISQTVTIQLMSMTRRALVGRTVGVLTILLAIGVAGSQEAHAASHITKDPKRDAYVISEDGQHLVPKPGPTGDVTSIRTTHSAAAVNVIVHTQKLGRSNFAEIDIVTSAKHRRHFRLTAMAFPGGRFVALTTGAGHDITCPRLRARFDRAHETVRAHIPRRCIEDPRWVRTGAVLMTSRELDTDPTTIDVAGKDGLTERWLNKSTHPPYGPRVHVN